VGSAWEFRGVIEGFYGTPWSWDARADVMRFCHQRGMTDYLYAPKNDPLHRERWRELYPADVLAGFERLVAEDTLHVGFAISPGLSMDYHSDDDRLALAAKVDQVVALGIDLICLAVDDIEARPGLGEDHAAVTSWLRDHLGDRARLLLVPTEYTGTASTPYLDALAAGVPGDVPIGWTGTSVVVDDITREDAEARAAALGGRPPFVWDNYPVNDSIMADRLFLGPLRGRADDLGAVCSGYAANPMVQPQASKPALASIAAYLAGDDPLTGWHDAVDRLDVRVIAEACDGVHPAALVAAVIEVGDGPDWVEPLRALDDWLRAAAGASAAAFGDEAAAWVEQVHQEADVGRAATRVLQSIRPVARATDDGHAVAARPDNRSATEHALALSLLWPAARRSSVSVMGPRCSFRPVLGQWPDGEWRYRAASLTEDGNAIDTLVRHALECLGRFEKDDRVTVAVDHRPIDVGDDGRFDAPPGSEITLTSGPAVTVVTAPTTPPLSDRRLD
jgi:hyaluronoglucosaminidase